MLEITYRSSYTGINVATQTLFEKISQKTKLNHVSIIDFGHNQMIIKIEKNDDNSSILNIKVNHGVSKGNELTVNSTDVKIVKLGRKLGNDILMEFPDESTSRVQLT